MNELKDKMITSGIGLMSIEGVQVLIPSPEMVGEIGKLLIQLAIGVVTIIRILRDSRKK